MTELVVMPFWTRSSELSIRVSRKGSSKVLALLLSAMLVSGQASTVLVPYWTDDAGYCKPLPGLDAGVHRPDGLSPIPLTIGDSLTFKFSVHHDVWLLPTQASFDACDFSTAQKIADTDRGGGCTEDDDLACINSHEGFVYKPSTPGTYWFSCSIHDHCVNGQKLAVTVVEGSDGHRESKSSSAAGGVALFFLGGVVGVVGALLFNQYIRGRRPPLSDVEGDNDEGLSMEQISSI